MDSRKSSPGLSLRVAPAPALSARPALSLRFKPYLWQTANLLFLQPDSLTDALLRMAEDLPIEVAPPVLSCVSLDTLPYDPCDPVSMDEEMARQISLLGGLPGRLGDAGRWCELLDARGYLNCSPPEAARAFDVGADAFRRALALLQAWVEPAGFFAGDLAECLLLQLNRMGQGDSDAAFLLLEGRDELENGALESFSRRWEWDPSRLKEAMRTLRRLDPNPGYAFARTGLVVPELAFGACADTVACRVMDENLPRLSMADDSSVDAASLKAARDILLRMESRGRVLARIGMFLAHAQSDYLLGISNTPTALNLRTIAAGTGIHISTVSRCLSGRWATSDRRGVFRLGSLLLRRVTDRSGNSRMNYADLEQVIRTGARDGLSDAELAAFMGMPRRTVAYHRRRLGYGPRGSA